MSQGTWCTWSKGNLERSFFHDQYNINRMQLVGWLVGWLVGLSVTDPAPAGVLRSPSPVTSSPGQRFVRPAVSSDRCDPGTNEPENI